MRYLISICIFGKDFYKLKNSEIVLYQSNAVIIIHIASQEKLKQLLTIHVPYVLTSKEHGVEFSACDKV